MASKQTKQTKQDDKQPEIQYYLLQVKIKVPEKEGFDLMSHIKKIAEVLKDYPKQTKCRCRFKVTGETRILAVYEVTNVCGLEKTLNGLAKLGYIEVTCDPMIQYEDFAKRIGVDSNLASPSPRNLTDDQCLWLEFNVEYPGKTMDQFLSTWKTEAGAALTARKQIHMELFKTAGERKVHLFFGGSAEKFDEISFQLPLMTQNGDNVKINSKALQNLDFYVKKMSEK